MTLTEFLLARLAEDEEAARSVKPLEDVPVMGGVKRQWFSHARLSYATEDGHPQRLADEAAATHFARHDPTRVLAECEAKRRIVELHVPHWMSIRECKVCADGATEEYGDPVVVGEDWPCPTLRLLAVPYADHPDYDEAWRP